MKIVSFNVNGVRAILKKGFPECLDSLTPDVIVLEELKLSEDKEESFPFKKEGYKTYFTISKVKKGYSGVAILTKVPPLSVHYGLEEGKYDDEGRIVTLEFEGFFLVGAYVPNSGEELKRLQFRQEFNIDMLRYLKDLDQKKMVVFTGDLNVAHEEIDIKNPKSNIHNAGFTKEEREDFTKLLSSGFSDTFRVLYPSKVTYSWWSYRFNARANDAGWRIDYFVVSDRMMKYVVDSKIHTEILGSDHCPVELEIKEDIE